MRTGTFLKFSEIAIEARINNEAEPETPAPPFSYTDGPYCRACERPVLSWVMNLKNYILRAEEKEAVANRIGSFLSGLKGIGFAYLHGSFLEGPFRDVDVAVYLLDPPPASPVELELQLETELARLVGYPCDVRMLNGAPASFRYNAIRYGRPLAVADDDARTEFVEAAIRDYCDFAPFRRKYLEDALGIQR